MPCLYPTYSTGECGNCYYIIIAIKNTTNGEKHSNLTEIKRRTTSIKTTTLIRNYFHKITHLKHI